MAKKKKKKSVRRINQEGYEKAFKILSVLQPKFLTRTGHSNCVLRALGKIPARNKFHKNIENYSKEVLNFFDGIPLAVLVEIQTENDWRDEEEMSNKERYQNMMAFLCQKIDSILDPTKVTLTV